MADDARLTDDADGPSRAELQALWAEAEALWDRHQEEPAFAGYVSADYAGLYRQLVRLRRRATSFLEWGSGLGVVAIMAGLLGYDAYGIEIEPQLVAHSRALARKHGARVRFAVGSFIPEEYEWDVRGGDEVQRTTLDQPSGYAELDMELRDFDLVYAYPWPDEHALFQNILRRHGRPGVLLLTHDVREGISLKRLRRR